MKDIAILSKHTNELGKHLVVTSGKLTPWLIDRCHRDVRLDLLERKLAEPVEAKQRQATTRRVLRVAQLLHGKLKDIGELLTGGTVKTQFNEPDLISIMGRVDSASRAMRSTYGPTKTHRADYQIAREEFQEVYGQLKKLIEVDFVNLQKKLEAAGLPWTPGRPIPKLKK